MFQVSAWPDPEGLVGIRVLTPDNVTTGYLTPQEAATLATQLVTATQKAEWTPRPSPSTNADLD